MTSDVQKYKRLTQQIVPFRMVTDRDDFKRYYHRQIFAEKIKLLQRKSVLDPHNEFCSF